MSAEQRGVTATELEARLYGYLKIPIADLLPAQPDSRPAAAGRADLVSLSVRQRKALERLRQAVWELRQDAARIGRIPPGYPRHIDLVMRVISALLPWYTRNLVQFGQRTSQAFQVMAEVLEEVIRTGHPSAAGHERQQTRDMPGRDWSPESRTSATRS